MPSQGEVTGAAAGQAQSSTPCLGLEFSPRGCREPWRTGKAGQCDTVTLECSLVRL